MDFIVRQMLGPYNFAIFARPNGHIHEPKDGIVDPAADHTFRRADCTDGKFAGMHRDAVPALLPYVVDFGEGSSCECTPHSDRRLRPPASPPPCLQTRSRGMLARNFSGESILTCPHRRLHRVYIHLLRVPPFRRALTQRCLPGAVFEFGRILNDLWQAHRGYPRSALPDKNASDFIATHFDGLPAGGTGCASGALQFPVPDPSIAESGYSALRAAWAAPGGGVTPEGSWNANWVATPRFRTCYAMLSPRFEAEIARGVPPAPPLAIGDSAIYASAMR